MELKNILLISYVFLGLINTYCFLIQRTVRKIRQNVLLGGIGLENKLYPDWYHWLLFVSYLRYISLAWLVFIDWRIAIVAFLAVGLLKIIYPVNDSKNIRIIKRYFINKQLNGSFSREDHELFSWIIKAEMDADTQKLMK